MATFGKTDIGSTQYMFHYANNKAGCIFTLTEDAIVSKLTVYFDGLHHTHAGGNVKGIIYDVVENEPINLKGVSEAVVVADGVATWYDFPFTEPVVLAAGDYLLGVITDGDCTGMADVAGVNMYNADAYADGPSDTFGDFTSSGGQRSIYATYTPSGATYTKTWNADVLFKKLGITKSLSVDAALQKQNIQEAFAVDAALQKTITKTTELDMLLKALDIQKSADVDALLQKFGILETFGVDTDFLKHNVIKSFALDARFGALLAQTISRQIDALFKRFGVTETRDVDVLFQQKDVSIQKEFDVLFKADGLEKTADVDAALQKCDILAQSYVDVFFQKIIEQIFSIDANFLASVGLEFGVDTVFGGVLLHVPFYLPLTVRGKIA